MRVREPSFSKMKKKKKKPHETFSRPVSALGKQSADNQRWRKEGERREKGGEERWRGGRNVSYSWMFHEWHTEDKSDWQRLCSRCTHSSPLGSLPLPVPPTLYHFYLSCLSPVCSGTLFLRLVTAVSRRCTKQSWTEVGFPFAGLVTHPSEVLLLGWKEQCTKELSMPKDKQRWSDLVRFVTEKASS